jgi:asparagine synthase (glutamine-hydrolysing)
VEKSIKPYEGERSSVGAGIRQVTKEAVRKRLLADVPVGVSLSGGLDSSIVTLCARSYLDQLHTFAVGMAGGSDLEAARLVSQTIGTTHHELIYSDQEMRQVLPEVVRSLETFDPALVRSAFPNWFLAKLASQEVKVMLTGEGADELYAGYDYLGGYRDPATLQRELIQITRNLHNTNLQRADRLSMAFGLEARVPFLDTESVAFALGLPAAWKVHARRAPKQLLRHAYRDHLPDSIVDRPKLKFSQGAGSSSIFWDVANATVSNRDFNFEMHRMKAAWGYDLPNKEALYYYRILREVLDDPIIFSQIAPSRSL